MFNTTIQTDKLPENSSLIFKRKLFEFCYDVGNKMIMYYDFYAL